MRRGTLALLFLSLLAVGPTPLLKGCGGGGMGRMEGGMDIEVRATDTGSVRVGGDLGRSRTAQQPVISDPQRSRLAA